MIDYAKMTALLYRDNPEIEKRIRTGIEENRKGEIRIVLKDAAGNRIPCADIRCEQRNHEFHFGGNSFLLDAFDSAEQNELHDTMFSHVFNTAVVPFYWASLEPERGVFRYARNSPKIFRRPPPDRVLEFCRRFDLTPKGHVLCWHLGLPDWLEKDPEIIAPELERRIASIAERYGESIRIWDVANEAAGYTGRIPMPHDHVRLAFELADKYFPRHAKLMYNENNWSYFGEYTQLYLMLRRLISQGCRIGGLGLQYHMFAKAASAENLVRDILDPEYLFRVLDLDASVGLPIDISEVTILGSDELPDPESCQADMLERLVRIWFSHPAIHSIIYWNLVDDCAFVRPGWNENVFHGGLLHKDLTPKKAYSILERLIRKEWHTSATIRYRAGESEILRGFRGEYDFTAKLEGGSFSGHFAITENDPGQCREFIVS